MTLYLSHSPSCHGVVQLDQSHQESQQLAGELRRKEEEVEQLHQDRLLELEKVSGPEGL